jgi:hypothetical protein
MKAPKLPSFFKTHSHKQFEMPTRYYDARKERIQNLVEKANKKSKGEFSKGDFSQSWRKKSTTSSGFSTFRVLLIIAILCFIAYYILKF